MNKSDLIEALAKVTGSSKTKATKIVRCLNRPAANNADPISKKV